MAKLFAGDLAQRVAYDCQQFYGGMGYIERDRHRARLARRPADHHRRRHLRDHEGDHRARGGAVAVTEHARRARRPRHRPVAGARRRRSRARSSRSGSRRAGTSCPGSARSTAGRGRSQDDAEALLVLKTTRDRFEALRERVLALHPVRRARGDRAARGGGERARTSLDRGGDPLTLFEGAPRAARAGHFFRNSASSASRGSSSRGGPLTEQRPELIARGARALSPARGAVAELEQVARVRGILSTKCSAWGSRHSWAEASS